MDKHEVVLVDLLDRHRMQPTVLVPIDRVPAVAEEADDVGGGEAKTLEEPRVELDNHRRMVPLDDLRRAAQGKEVSTLDVALDERDILDIRQEVVDDNDGALDIHTLFESDVLLLAVAGIVALAHV